MLGSFLFKLPEIARVGDLRPLDYVMADTGTAFRFHDTILHFDCSYCDAKIKDGSFAFGIVREILIRDCYVQFLPHDAFKDLGNVVDLGANRGMFTIAAGARAERVLAVEAEPGFRSVIEHNVRINDFDHVIIETSFVGSGGFLAQGTHDHVDFKKLLDRHGFDRVDLLKIDIEGSEFGLFEHPDWLPRVQNICMELHRAHGSVEPIRLCLEEHGFQLAFADSNMRRVSETGNYEFLYAWR